MSKRGGGRIPGIPEPMVDEEKVYLQKVTDILARSCPGARTSHGPAQILDHLYIGNMQDAHNLSLLKRLGITHILNCAGQTDYSKKRVENPYASLDGGSIIHGYLEFEALDNESYPILSHFRDAKFFINSAESEGGRVLVHCELGVNRSGAICAAYVMEHEDMTFLEAVRLLKINRPVVLCNTGFRKQLHSFAKKRGYLHRSKLDGRVTS